VQSTPASVGGASQIGGQQRGGRHQPRDPGFGGQEFIEGTLPKIRKVRERIDSRRLLCELEVDGGVNERTVPLVVSAGADVLVIGSGIFRSGKSIEESMQSVCRASRHARTDRHTNCPEPNHVRQEEAT